MWFYCQAQFKLNYNTRIWYTWLFTTSCCSYVPNVIILKVLHQRIIILIKFNPFCKGCLRSKFVHKQEIINICFLKLEGVTNWNFLKIGWLPTCLFWVVFKSKRWITYKDMFDLISNEIEAYFNLFFERFLINVYLKWRTSSNRTLFVGIL